VTAALPSAAVAAPVEPPIRLARAWRARPFSILLIACINTAIALVLWQEDARAFWHPLLTVQLYGFSIAYCVNAAQPWRHARGLRWLIGAAAVGALIGVALVIAVKGGFGMEGFTSWDEIVGKRRLFAYNVFAAFLTGVFISLLFYTRLRERRAAADLHRAESERLQLARQTVEAQLKLMQAQIEPHFLFNTLASVQYLIETDPPAAGRMLGHLIDYLRAALPQLRASSSTIAKEVELARALLSIVAMRIGERLAFDTDVPAELAHHPFPPNLLISLVENAIKHGIEPAPDGGRVTIAARRVADRVAVSVADTGRGLDASAGRDAGVGLANVRERVAALYGSGGRFALEPLAPRGARATIEIPYALP
jgi:signal transduction histidine kinase